MPNTAARVLTPVTVHLYAALYRLGIIEVRG